MKIEKVTAYHVISEPGDCTRYDFFLIDRLVVPGNELKYPTRVPRGLEPVDDRNFPPSFSRYGNPNTVNQVLKGFKLTSQGV